MREKKKNRLTHLDALKLLRNSGLRGTKRIAVEDNGDQTASLEERIERILGLLNKSTTATTMLYFIMYDIEDNKVRRYISKYLEKKGCIRLQKSIFLASSERKEFAELCQTLKEVNEVYENHDSIVIAPVSTDEVKAMHIIGKKIDLLLYTDKPNTLFF